MVMGVVAGAVVVVGASVRVCWKGKCRFRGSSRCLVVCLVVDVDAVVVSAMVVCSRLKTCFRRSAWCSCGGVWWGRDSYLCQTCRGRDDDDVAA